MGIYCSIPGVGLCCCCFCICFCLFVCFLFFVFCCSFYLYVDECLFQVDHCQTLVLSHRSILKTSVCMQLSEGGPVMVEEESDSDDEPPEIVMVPHAHRRHASMTFWG